MESDWFTKSAVVQQHLDSLDAKIKPGDWYLGTRNGPPQVLLCGSVDEENGWINPAQETLGYSFDSHECRRFKSSVSEETMQAIYLKAREELRAWTNQLFTTRVSEWRSKGYVTQVLPHQD